MSEIYTICTSCHVPHYENCGTCFGFGLEYDGSPVTAHDAKYNIMIGLMPCPECHSTIEGIPKTAE